MTWLQCDGWWEQNGFGRQPMHGLRLCYDDGHVSGEGEDVVGQFEIRGTVTATAASLVKHYRDAHEVAYFGIRDGEGAFFGRWSIFGIGGKWLIKVRAAEGPPTSISDL